MRISLLFPALALIAGGGALIWFDPESPAAAPTHGVRPAATRATPPQPSDPPQSLAERQIRWIELSGDGAPGEFVSTGLGIMGGGAVTGDAGAAVHVRAARASEEFGTVFGTGTGTRVLDGRFVLTAAHVVDDADLYVEMRTGNNWKQPAALAVGKSIALHRLYEGAEGRLRSDLALVPTSSSFPGPSARLPASVEDLPEVGDCVLVQGWGARAFDEHGRPTDFPAALHEVKVEAARVHPAMIDLQDPQGGAVQTFADGDSGGPAWTCEENPADRTLIGVISHRQQREQETRGPQDGALMGVIPVATYLEWLDAVADAVR